MRFFNYHNVTGSFLVLVANHISRLCDNNFRFAPYPGGGGCFDLDVTFFFTNKFVERGIYEKIAFNTFSSIFNDQKNIGGFVNQEFFLTQFYHDH